jgi:transposase-like protein
MQNKQDLRHRTPRDSEQPRSDGLPDQCVRYWMPKQKARIVEALRRQELTVSEACEHYGLTPDELASWSRAYDWGGIRGLTLAGMKMRRRTVHEPGRA